MSLSRSLTQARQATDVMSASLGRSFAIVHLRWILRVASPAGPLRQHFTCSVPPAATSGPWMAAALSRIRSGLAMRHLSCAGMVRRPRGQEDTVLTDDTCPAPPRWRGLCAQGPSQRPPFRAGGATARAAARAAVAPARPRRSTLTAAARCRRRPPRSRARASSPAPPPPTAPTAPPTTTPSSSSRPPRRRATRAS